ncbi:MAG TPA: cytochrome c oxidase assembly protein [Acidimicrobiales bacterium]|nr:cytochrome c oxidase assembly protein [Acidimicrobiales bacterium]
MSNLPFNAHNALTAWQWGPFSIAVVVVLVAIAYWYLRADWLLAARGRRWPAKRTIPFMAGLVTVDLALQSPVATFTGSYFQAHVVQHLLLMAVGPPLVALGAPSTLLLQTAGRRTKTRWLAVLRSRPFAVITHPVVVWFLYFGVMFAFFLTPLVNFAMHHMALMDAINVGFLFGGTLYWWPMVGLDPIVHWRMGYGARIANLAIGVPFESFLGIAIMYQKHSVASMYTLASTHSGGALLWAATELSTFFGLVPVFVQWQKADSRAGSRADRRAEPSLALANAAPSARQHASLEREADAELDLEALGASAARAAFGNQFRPLLQPGNSSWEAMWKAKAGFVPSSRGAKPNSPPLHTTPKRGKT